LFCLIEKYFRKAADPSSLAAYGLVDELIKLVVPASATSAVDTPIEGSDMGTAQTVLSLLATLWFVTSKPLLFLDCLAYFTGFV
jgi:hypothetical protein